LNHLAYATFNPPYSFRQRKYVASTMPSSLQAAVTLLALAQFHIRLPQLGHYRFRIETFVAHGHHFLNSTPTRSLQAGWS
jgi:hypothetical protein